MLPFLFALTLQTDTLAHSRNQPVDTLRTDTLREVIIHPNRRLPIEDAIDESLKRNPVPRTMTLGDVLEKLSPGLNDKITHPFAIKQRKKERRHTRLMKALDRFDKVESFEEQLQAAYERQMAEDSIAAAKKQLEREWGSKNVNGI